MFFFIKYDANISISSLTLFDAYSIMCSLDVSNVEAECTTIEICLYQ